MVSENFELHMQKFLDSLFEKGWRDNCMDAYTDIENIDGVGEKIADALMAYWAKDPTLTNFSAQLNGASTLNLPDEERRVLIASMNIKYINAQENLPDEVRTCYEELRFWDSCSMPEALSYFDRLSAQFSRIAAAQTSISDEVAAILKIPNASRQMKSARKQLIQNIRTSLRGRLAMQRDPAERLKLFLKYATGVAGTRIVDKPMWETMLGGCVEAAKTSPETKEMLRKMLMEAANGEIRDRPFDTIANINELLNAIGSTSDAANKKPSDKPPTSFVNKKDYDKGAPLGKKKMWLYSGMIGAIVILLAIAASQLPGVIKKNGEKQAKPTATPKVTEMREEPQDADTPKPKKTSAPSPKKTEKEEITPPPEKSATPEPTQTPETATPTPTPKPEKTEGPGNSPEVTFSEEVITLEPLHSPTPEELVTPSGGVVEGDAP